MPDRVKEKLVELQQKADTYGCEECDKYDCCEECPAHAPNGCRYGFRADYLIAHGVTVQEWISVKDRLPERNAMVFVYCKNKTIQGGATRHIGSYDNGFWFLKTQPGTASFPHLEWEVTHWMPLPEPPKGE